MACWSATAVLVAGPADRVDPGGSEHDQITRLSRQRLRTSIIVDSFNLIDLLTYALGALGEQIVT